MRACGLHGRLVGRVGWVVVLVSLVSIRRTTLHMSERLHRLSNPQCTAR
jgi:hypothetical protein